MSDIPKKLADSLSNSQWFNRLAQHAKKLEKLQHLFNQAVSADIAQAGRILQFDDEVLWIGAINAAWAAKIKYLAPTLIQELRVIPNFSNLKSLRCTVLMGAWVPKVTPVEPRLTLSTATRQSLAECSHSVKDPELRLALLKMIDRG